MKKLIYTLIAICGMALPSGQAHAEVGDLYNIKLGSSPYYDYGAAIDANSGHYWNAFSAVEQVKKAPLILDDLDFGGVSIRYDMVGSSGHEAIGTAILAPNTELFQGYLYTSATEGGLFTISGLDVGTYNLYVYSQGETGVSTSLSFTANGVSGSLANDGFLENLTLNQNYLIKTVEVGSSGVMQVALGNNSFITGMQLYHSATPEPASMVLLGIGGALAAAKLRRKRGGEASSAAAA